MNNIENQYVAPDLMIVELYTDQCILTGSGIAGGDAGGEDGWDEYETFICTRITIFGNFFMQ